MKPKNNLSFFVCILFFLFFSNVIQAAHINGGVMTYKCLGGGDYEITLKVYRDCFAGGAGYDGPTSGRISIYQGNSILEFDKIVMPEPSISTVLLDPIDCVLFPDDICVEEGIYVIKLSDQNILLPNSMESYHIAYQRCCRSNTISNINNPMETGVTYSVEITSEAQAVCNNTPAFDNYPPIVMCVGEPIEYNQEIIESDGDSLVFSFCNPFKGGGTAGWMTPGNPSDFDGTNPDPDAPPPYDLVTFASPFTPNDLIGSDPILSIDSNTGFITGTPNTAGQFVIGICVQEFRNGEFLSQVKRDIHFRAAVCEDIMNLDYVYDDFNGNFQFDNISVNANSYEWDFGDGGTSNEESPMHQYAQTGIYTVTLTGYNVDCDLVETISKEVVVFVTTDVEELENQFKVSILPNPNDGNFILNFENIFNQKIEIELYDMGGRDMMRKAFDISNGNTSHSINLSHFPKGIYCLMIKSNNGIKVEKLVIQ